MTLTVISLIKTKISNALTDPNKWSQKTSEVTSNETNTHKKVIYPVHKCIEWLKVEIAKQYYIINLMRFKS